MEVNFDRINFMMVYNLMYNSNEIENISISLRKTQEHQSKIKEKKKRNMI